MAIVGKGNKALAVITGLTFIFFKQHLNSD